jgi:predicted GTPase
MDTAEPAKVALVRENIARHAPEADVVLAESEVIVARPGEVRGKRVLVVEDGPTLTHGGMPSGAGLIAAERYGAARVVDPRPYAAGSIARTFREYPHIGPVLPAMGYGTGQIEDLERTINGAECDLVLFATPIQLPRVLSIGKPAMRVRYEYKDRGAPTLQEVLLRRLKGHLEGRAG